MKAQVIRLSGGTNRTMGGRTKRIGTLSAGDRRRIVFPVPTKPGNYLVQVEFKKMAGESIGRLGDYFRVVAPTTDARMTLSATSLHPGDVLGACLENFGTATLEYGPGSLIETFDGSTWGRAAISPPGGTTDIAYFLGAGQRRPLSSVTIPPKATPGLYRYVLQGTADLSSEFQILPG